MQFKNGSAVIICLRSKEYVETELPIMRANSSKSNKRIWDHKMNEYLESKRVLKGNLHNLFTILMALYEAEVKNQI